MSNRISLFAQKRTVKIGEVDIQVNQMTWKDAILFGAEVGDNVVINPRSTLLNNFRIDSCRVSATDTLEIKLKNGSLGSQTINQAFDIVIFKE